MHGGENGSLFTLTLPTPRGSATADCRRDELHPHPPSFTVLKQSALQRKHHHQASYQASLSLLSRSRVMKMFPSLSVRAALAALYAGSGLVPSAAMACDKSVFESSPSAVLTEEISTIQVGLAGNCTGEGLFQMPRMTWTIEPNPDDSVNTTSVFLSPPNIGTVATGELSCYIYGIEIDRAAVANASEIGVLIQAPKDGLNAVEVTQGAPFFVNIVKGFTRLTSLWLGGADTCNPVRDGYIEAECPYPCDDLYTPEEVKGIGSSIVADLSEVNVEVDLGGTLGTFIQSISVDAFGQSVNNLSLALPAYGEKGVPVQFSFGSASSKIEIKGRIDCAFERTNMTNGGRCAFESNRASGCKDCSNEMVIDGSINGYFNVSAESPLDIKMSDGGCDHLAPFDNDSMDRVKCTEGNATVNVEPLPCVSADIGTLECGTSPFWEHSPCFCVAPLPVGKWGPGYCDPNPNSNSSGLGVVWIVYLLLPIVAVLMAL
mmetsp:Transcript_7914/g.13056  ORF Transcript_7914/g.13056 Transcript_7914/m.13056 type:complete len:488 (-) Transcript_7914:199-1662(-)